MPVDILTANFYRGRFDTRAFALQPIRHDGLVFVPFRPSQVHTKKHLRPVLAFRSPGARVNGHDCIARVVLSRKEHARLKRFQIRFKGLQFAFEFAVNVLAFFRKLK